MIYSVKTLKKLIPQESYRNIPIISPGLIFVQKAFLVGLFSGKLIFGGACYWVGLDNKNSIKHELKVTA